MSKTHRKHEQTHPQMARDSRAKLSNRRERMQQALAQQEQQSRGVEFPQPEVPTPRRDW